MVRFIETQSHYEPDNSAETRKLHLAPPRLLTIHSHDFVDGVSTIGHLTNEGRLLAVIDIVARQTNLEGQNNGAHGPTYSSETSNWAAKAPKLGAFGLK